MRPSYNNENLIKSRTSASNLFSKRFFGVVLLCGWLSGVVVHSVLGQSTQPPAAFSLEESIAYAFENNDSVKNAILEQQIAEAQVGETRAAGLPQINANASLSKNYIVPTSFLPAVIIPEEARDPNIGPDDFVGVQFSTPYIGNATVELEQLIFDGSYFVGLKAAATYKELSTKATIKTKIDIAEAVTKAYYAALIAQERIALAEENFRRLDTLLAETQVMYENGFAERIEVSRIRVQFNNAKVEREKAQRAIELSYYLLKFQMGMRIEQPITLKDNLRDVEIDFNEALIHEFQYADRIEYEQLSTNQALAELDLKNNQVQYLPRLSAFINFGASMGTTRSSQIFNFSETWFENGAFGATFSLPIFDGLNKSYRIQQNRLVIQQLKNSVNSLENSINLGIAQSKINLENSRETIEAYKENMALAAEVAEVAKIKYKEGVGSSIEVVDAEIAYQEAETNYLGALYDALVAKVELEKALGVLLDDQY